MGGKSSGGDTETTIRYAGYIEGAHKAMIQSAITLEAAIMDRNPYTALTIDEPDDAFFGAAYTITSYPTLYDMFGKFVAGLDIEVLWNQEITDSVYGAVLNEIVAADSDMMDDELESQISKMKAGMRDINSVMATGFMVTDGNMRDTKIKALYKERADLRNHFATLGQDRWSKHLQWNQNVISQYMELNRLYWATKMDNLNIKGEMLSKDVLWGFTVLDHKRVIVACLQGATDSKVKGQEASKVGKAISGAMGGAALGGMLGSAIGGTVGGTAVGSLSAGGLMMEGGIAAGPLGAIAGGLLGLGAGLLS
jgi:hypothetical protein